MNPFIEILNRCGENAIRFAWPMLWQSSVLIAVLFAADFVLRRHVRAAVRHALWLVVLVKLLLPPSLALPTSVAWWLFPSASTQAKAPTTRFTFSYGTDAVPALPPLPASAFTPPPPALSASAWMLIAWGAIGFSLLAWLMIRWQRVMRDLQRVLPVPPWLNELFNETRDAAGLRRPVYLQLTDQTMSPAVCGLFRPVILLPQSLVEKLPPAQLRAVLLHELVHLRRGDVWTNCTQALVQIVYWWHPLLWFANARIRRVREEAVDDAVMLTLRDDAEVYAPTLLEVAKLAFHRPLASLGLVGILESRSALRQRIERLVNFRAPRKAGLTLVSLCGICIFSAAALPMGEATIPAGKQSVAQAIPAEQTMTVKVNPEVFIKNVKAEAATYMHAPTDGYTDILLDILRGDGVDCHPPHGLAFNTRTGEITTENSPDDLEIFRRVIEQLNRPDGKCALPLGLSSFHRKSVLIAGQFYKMRAADFDDLAKELVPYKDPRGGFTWWSVSPDRFNAFNEHIKSLGLSPFQRPRVQTGHGLPAQFYCGTETNGLELSCLPFVTVDGDQRFVDLSVRVNTKGWFTDNPAGDWPVFSGTNSYAVSGKASAEDHGGIVLRAENPGGSPANNLVMVFGIQIVTNNPPPAQFQDRLAAIVTRTNPSLPPSNTAFDLSGQTAQVFKLSHPIRSEALKAKLLEAGVKIPPTIIHYTDEGILLARGSQEQLALVYREVLKLDGLSAAKAEAASKNFTPRENALAMADKTTTNLETRTFKVDPNIFARGLENSTAGSTGSTNISLAAKQFFTTLGLNLDPPKSVFFNSQLGVLFVRATGQDLDVVEKAVQVLIYTPPQIHIKTRFIEVPQEALQLLGTNFIPTGTTSATGILADANSRRMLYALEHSQGVETLAEPEVTTLIGRQTQMRATESISVVDGINPQALTPPGVLSTDNTKGMKTVQTETGPVFDVIPHLLSDGRTLSLNVSVSVIEFAGYDERGKTNLATVYVDGRKKQVNVPIPQFTTRELKTNVEVQDGQTVILGGPISTQITTTKETVPVSGGAPAGELRFRKQTTRTGGEKKQLLVLITATLVDAAGNRIHSDDEMRIAHPGPPQAPR